MTKYDLLEKIIKDHNYNITGTQERLLYIISIAISIGDFDLREKASNVFDVVAMELFNDGIVSYGNEKLMWDIFKQLRRDSLLKGVHIELK